MVACPLCSTSLEDSVFDGVPIQVCATHGTWLDKGELLAITEEERWKPTLFWEELFRTQSKPPRRDGRHLPCPHCAQVMEPMPYHGVIIDWCRDHGVWLDSGEMEAILNNLRLDPNYIRGVALRVSERVF
jgi:Zn-finger nucleic acid-binding protein